MPIKKRRTIALGEEAFKRMETLVQEVFPGRSMTSTVISSVMLYCKLQKLGKLHEVSQYGIQDLNGNTYTGGK